MTGKVKLEKRPAANLAYVENVGPYDKMPWQDCIETLYGWAKEKKVMPGFYPMGIYLDCPDRKPAEELRSQVAISYKGKAGGKGRVKTRKLPEMTVATLSHKGPGKEFKESYRMLNEWIDAKGYEWSGPSMEVYSKKPEMVGDTLILYAKIMAPVKKKRKRQ